jgi:hypothetical protein
MDTRSVDLVASYADVLQVGSRNMHNYDLLREVGRCRRPVLLKRGLSATIEELLWSAEYIVHEGNQDVVLCERGIRTFERETRNTLDISAVPLLRQKSYLPVIVDVSHAAGRRDILGALGRAALAAGASGLMVEVHPCPRSRAATTSSSSTSASSRSSWRGWGWEVGGGGGVAGAGAGARAPRRQRGNSKAGAGPAANAALKPSTEEKGRTHEALVACNFDDAAARRACATTRCTRSTGS